MWNKEQFEKEIRELEEYLGWLKGILVAPFLDRHQYLRLLPGHQPVIRLLFRFDHNPRGEIEKEIMDITGYIVELKKQREMMND